MTAFWDMAPCSLVEVDRCFRGTYCLHQQVDDYEFCLFSTILSVNSGRSLVNINRLIFVMVKCCVLFEVRTERLQRVNFMFCPPSLLLLFVLFPFHHSQSTIENLVCHFSDSINLIFLSHIKVHCSDAPYLSRPFIS
jgi:hypothetical protein